MPMPQLSSHDTARLGSHGDDRRQVLRRIRCRDGACGRGGATSQKSKQRCEEDEVSFHAIKCHCEWHKSNTSSLDLLDLSDL